MGKSKLQNEQQVLHLCNALKNVSSICCMDTYICSKYLRTGIIKDIKHKAAHQYNRVNMGLKIMKMYLPLNLHFFLTKRDLWEKLPLLTFVKSGCGVMWHFYIILPIFFHFFVLFSIFSVMF